MSIGSLYRFFFLCRHFPLCACLQCAFSLFVISVLLLLFFSFFFLPKTLWCLLKTETVNNFLFCFVLFFKEKRSSSHLICLPFLKRRRKEKKNYNTAAAAAAATNWTLLVPAVAAEAPRLYWLVHRREDLFVGCISIRLFVCLFVSLFVGSVVSLRQSVPKHKHRHVFSCAT